jgi:DNA-binding NarL/FixJ family response regulator
VLIAGSSALARQCVAAALNHDRRFEASPQDRSSALVDEARESNVDVAVVDVDGSAPEADAVARLAAGGTAVLALSSSAGGAKELLEAGARGYLDKNCDLRDLEQAIERVHTGNIVVVTGAAGELLNGNGNQDGHPDLTDRELDVLRLVAIGQTNAEIARQLCITEHTVKGHLGRILSKLALENRTKLAGYAFQRGLAEPLPPAVQRAPVEPPESRVS